MFWADKIAQILKDRKLPLEWVDDMKTPSGKVHVGALRGVVVHDVIYKALKGAGVNAKYTYVFDNHDPMDGLPVYLPAEVYEKYMGLPLFKVPSPVKGYENYAEYYAKDFQKVFEAIGCYPEIIWASDLYKSGKMNDSIKICLDEAQKIRDIYEEMYKKKVASDWYPFTIYCEKCGKVSTTTVNAWDGEKVSYTCDVDKVKWTKGCGHKGSASPFATKDHIPGKLPWKIEWPAKWKAMGVTVEGAGKDHMSAGGSHDLSSLVCERVLKYDVPFPLAYEFFLVGGKKMSSSKGRGTSASDMLEMLPPELLRFLMVRTNIKQAINFDPAGDTIPNLFDEYQRAADSFFEKKDEELARIFELSQIGDIKAPPRLRFSILAQWVQMPNMKQKIEEEGLVDWAKYAHIWVEQFAPQEERFSIKEELPPEAKALSDLQKKYLKKIAGEVDYSKEGEEIQTQVYAIAKEIGLGPKDAFGAIYLVLLGKNHGPKAAWLIKSKSEEFVKKRFLSV